MSKVMKQQWVVMLLREAYAQLSTGIRGRPLGTVSIETLLVSTNVVMRKSIVVSLWINDSTTFVCE